MIPLADRLLVKPDPIVTETTSGLALVEDWPQETSGVVMSIGPTVRDLAVGDHILFGQHVGQEMVIGNDRLFVMRERDVLAILERTA